MYGSMSTFSYLRLHSIQNKNYEAEVARRTFGKKLKHTALYYAIGNKFDQRPEFRKKIFTTLSSHIYEFGTARYKGRNKKSEATESLKIESKKEEEYSYDEESLEDSIKTIGGNDEDYTP